jgi:hypothetical protein
MQQWLVLSLNRKIAFTNDNALHGRTSGQEKSGSTEPLTKRQGREGRISGKAMQDEL